MALQNLFGDIALDSSVQDTNLLLQQLADLTNTLNILIQRQAMVPQPIVGTTGVPMVSLSSSSSNPTYAPFYTAVNGTYDARFGIVSNLPQLQEASLNCAANAIYSNIKVS